MNHLPLDKSITLDKELKKAGVEMETQYGYAPYVRNPPQYMEVDCPWGSNKIVRPTLSEMIELLPRTIKVKTFPYVPEIYTYTTENKGKNWAISYICRTDKGDRELLECNGHTLLEAVYEALLWCLREGYLVGKE